MASIQFNRNKSASIAAKCALTFLEEHTRSNLEWGDFLVGGGGGGGGAFLFSTVCFSDVEVWIGWTTTEWRRVIDNIGVAAAAAPAAATNVDEWRRGVMMMVESEESKWVNDKNGIMPL